MLLKGEGVQATDHLQGKYESKQYSRISIFAGTSVESDVMYLSQKDTNISTKLGSSETRLMVFLHWKEGESQKSIPGIIF